MRMGEFVDGSAERAEKSGHERRQTKSARELAARHGHASGAGGRTLRSAVIIAASSAAASSRDTLW